MTPASPRSRHLQHSSDDEDNDSITIEISHSSGGYSDEEEGYRDPDYEEETETALKHPNQAPNGNPPGPTLSSRPPVEVPWETLKYPQGVQSQTIAPAQRVNETRPHTVEKLDGPPSVAEQNLMGEVQRLRAENKNLRAENHVQVGQILELTREKEKNTKLLKRYKARVQNPDLNPTPKRVSITNRA